MDGRSHAIAHDSVIEPGRFKGRLDQVELHTRTDTQNFASLSRLVGVARKHRWILVSTIAFALVLGLIVTLLMTPMYTATSTLEIQRKAENFTDVRSADGSENAGLDPEYYQTQYGLLEARSLAERVAAELKLSDDASFFDLFGASGAESWFVDGRLSAEAPPPAERVRQAGGILLQHITVEPERLSRLVKISFTSPDPALSKRVIDAWSVNFIGLELARQYETTSYARKFLEDRLSQLRGRIDQSERQLVAYAASEGIINIPQSAAPNNEGQLPERSLAADDLVTLNRELGLATADRIRAESRIDSTGALAEAVGNAGISSLRATRSGLAAEYSKLMEQFEPGYPEARALDRQIRQLDTSIAAEEERVRSTLNEAYRAANRREQQLRQQVDSLKSGLLDIRARSIQYNVLTRDVDTNRQLYDALLQRYKEIGVAGGVGVNNISVVDPATLPRAPSSPILALNLLISLLAGLGIGVGIAALKEQLSDRIDDPADAAVALDMPLLGTTPNLLDRDPELALDDPKNALTESYISLQTTLAFATHSGFPNTLAVTSTRPGEGKSVTAYALAYTLARLGKRTLLIDGDMRSPSIHHLLQIQNGSGLSNYLSGDDALEELFVSTKNANLIAMSAGPQPPNAANLLSGDRLPELLKRCSPQFDHIIVDAPPVLGLADAPLIGRAVEGVIVAIEAHATEKSTARVAISRLRESHLNLLGVVVTKFNRKKAHYGYGHDYGYSYEYGDKSARAEA